MNSKPGTLQELKIRNAVAHARFLAAVVARTEAELIEPRMPAGWTIKDILGHLAWWDRWLVFTLYPDDARFAANPPPMIDEIRDGKLSLDEINARVFEYNKARSLADVRAEYVEAFRASAAVGAALTEAEVFDPSGRSALIGWSVAELVFGIYEHYEEHAHEIETAFGS
jgi:hypothetical protein